MILQARTPRVYILRDDPILATSNEKMKSFHSYDTSVSILWESAFFLYSLFDLVVLAVPSGG